MGQFVQIIEYSSSRIDEIRAHSEEFRLSQADYSGPKPLHVTIAADRDNPGRYMTVVRFESHEDAMQNSARPEIDEFARALAKLCDGPPSFRNLDVLESYSP